MTISGQGCAGVVPQQPCANAQRASDAAAYEREGEPLGQRSSHASAASSSRASPFKTASATAFSTMAPNSGMDTFTTPGGKELAVPSALWREAKRAADVPGRAHDLDSERANAVVALRSLPGLGVAHVQILANEGAELAWDRGGWHGSANGDRECGVRVAVHPGLAVVGAGCAGAFVRESLICEHLDRYGRGSPRTCAGA